MRNSATAYPNAVSADTSGIFRPDKGIRCTEKAHFSLAGRQPFSLRVPAQHVSPQSAGVVARIFLGRSVPQLMPEGPLPRQNGVFRDAAICSVCHEISKMVTTRHITAHSQNLSGRFRWPCLSSTSQPWFILLPLYSIMPRSFRLHKLRRRRKIAVDAAGKLWYIWHRIDGPVAQFGRAVDS